MSQALRPRVILFSQGDEVLTGQTVDTNAAWMAARLDTLGLDVVRHVTVGDCLPDLISVLIDISQQADVCICSGGLGPTQDDLTAEAVSQAFELPLLEDSVALKSMEAFFAKRGVAMPDVNRKQALLPQGAIRLDNAWGTAPGFSVSVEGCQFFFVPGVPFEMKQLYAHAIEPTLRAQLELTPPRRIILRILGMGESRIQELLNTVELLPNVDVSFRAGLPENELKLRFPPDCPNADLRDCVQRVKDALGDVVYAVDGLDESIRSLDDLIDQKMRRAGLRLALVETLSQGQIAVRCQPDWLLSSQIYPESLDALSHFDVPLTCAVIDKQRAKQLAGRLKVLTGAPIALCQLQQRSEDSQEPDSILTAVSFAKGTMCISQPVHGRPERRRIMAAAHAFDLLRQVLQSMEG